MQILVVFSSHPFHDSTGSMIKLFALQTIESSPCGEYSEGEAVTLSQLVFVFPSSTSLKRLYEDFTELFCPYGINCFSNSSFLNYIGRT